MVFSLSVALFFLIRHFMYILDSYVYTAEFHFNFMRTNQLASHIDLFRDYFKALGPIGSLPYLMAADIIGTRSMTLLFPAALTVRIILLLIFFRPGL